MKKVAFYGRYSSANQTEQSIEGQRHVCEKYAAANDLQIVAEYIDRAQSGTTDKRQQFQQMISDSERGMFEGILVYKLDRFARDRYDSAIYKKKLRERGISVISATEPITDTPEGVIMEALIEGMDMYYSMELARKMNRGKAESVRKGKYVGNMPPIGYKVADHRLVVDELTAPIVQEVFRRYTAGETQGQILANLNRRGIPNNAGHEWSTTNISKLLQNRTYIGTYAVHGCGESHCPAIVDQDTWDAAQKRREESVRLNRSRKGGYNFILTGKTVCAQCGTSVSGVSMQGGKYHYYKCRKNCTGHIPAEKLHERVRLALAEYLTEDKLEELAQGAYAEYQSEQVVDERPIIEKEIADIDKQLQNAAQAILRGVEFDALNDTVESLKARREELRQRLNEIPTMKPELTYEMFLAMLQIIVDKAAESDDLTQLVGTVVNRIIIDGKAEHVIICINLTNEDNDPPMDQIMFRLKDVQFEFPVYFDLEEKKQFDLGKEKVSAIMRAFLEKVEKAGYFVGLYGSASSLVTHTVDDIKSRYTIWLAHWCDQTNYSGAYGIWQHSEKGKVAGISGNVDLDIGYKDFPTIIKGKGLNGYGAEPVLPNPPAPAAEDGITVEVTVDGKKYSGKLNKA